MSEVNIIVSPPVVANVVVAETPANINAEAAAPVNVVAAGTPPVGLPRGGTTGQIAQKQSNADWDIIWVDAEVGGGGISDAPNNANSYMRSGAAWVIAATVARTGAFADLTGKPNTAAGYGIPAATSAADGYATSVQIAKLDGIATGATANDTDANLKNRANHTGTQPSSTISDFDTAVDARIENVVGAAPSALDTLAEIADALNDDPDFAATMTTALAGKEPTISSGTSSQYFRGDKVMADLNADVVPDGVTNKAFTAIEKTKLAGIAANATANDTDANLKNRANHTGTQTASTISDFSSATDARIAATTEAFQIAASDETTNLTTGTGKVTFRMPYAFTLTGIRASLSTAQSAGSDLIVDVNKNGTTLMTTSKLRFDNTEKTTVTSSNPPALTTTALSDDDEISIDIDQVGTAGAKGLKVTLFGHR